MNLLLIDDRLKSLETFILGCNENTRHLTYGLEDSFEELKIKIQNLEVSSFNHVGFVFEDEGILKTFVSYNPFITFDESSNINDNLTTQFIKELVSTYNVETLDFLACDLLLNDTWKSYFEYLQIQNSTEERTLIVRASSNKSGNLQHGGDWILESTNEDISSLYFNENIGEWSHLLGSTLSSINIMLTNDETDNLYTAGTPTIGQSHLLLRYNGHYMNSEYIFNKNIISCESTIDSISFLTDETSNNLYILGRNIGNKFGFGNSLAALDISNININIQNKRVIQVCLPRIHTASSATSMYILTDESLNNLYSCGTSLLGLGATTTANTFQRITNLNQKILMVTGTTYTVELITDETNNNIYYLDSTTTNLFVKRNDINLMTKKVIYIERGQNAGVLTDETSNNLYVLGSNGSGTIGLGNVITSVSNYTNVSTYSTNLLNKRVEKVYMNQILSNTSTHVLTDEVSNNLYASGYNIGISGLYLGIGENEIRTFTKVSNYSSELLNKRVTSVNFNTMSTSITTSELSNNLYSTGNFSTRNFGKPITHNNDILNSGGYIKTFTNVSILSNELINKQVKIVTGYGYETTKYFSCAITTENPAINSNIYVCGSIDSTLMSINKSTLRFKKMHPPIGKKFVKFEQTSATGIYAISNEASNNLYVCSTNSPLNTSHHILTNISLTQSAILNKKILNISATDNLVCVLTDEASNNLYGATRGGGYLIGDGTSVASTVFKLINNNIVNQKVINISCNNSYRTLLTDEASNNYYALGDPLNGVLGNGQASGSLITTFTKITNGISGKKIISSESNVSVYRRTFLVSDETSNNLYTSGYGYLGNGKLNTSSSPITTFIKISNNIQNKKILKVSDSGNTVAIITNDTSFNNKSIVLDTIKTIVTSGPTIRSSAYSPTLNRIVSVGLSTTNTSFIVYSDDNGNTWINTNITGSTYNLKTLNSIIWVPELSKFFACGNYNVINTVNKIISSSDGISWGSHSTPIQNTGFYSIIWSKEKSTLLFSGDTKIIYSTNSGSTFVVATLPSTITSLSYIGFYKITWVKEISKFICVGTASSTLYILYSSNGTSWTAVTNTFSGNSPNIAWSPKFNKLFIVNQYNSVLSSSDGINWTTASIKFDNSIPTSNLLGTISSLSWDTITDTFVLVGNYSPSGSKTGIFESIDGINWIFSFIKLRNTVNGYSSGSDYGGTLIIPEINKYLLFYVDAYGDGYLKVAIYNYFNSNNLYILGTGVSTGFNGNIIENFNNATNQLIERKQVIDVFCSSSATIITTNDTSNNIYIVGTNTAGQTGVNDKINRTTFTLPYNLNIKANVYVPPVIATSVPVVINTAPPSIIDSSGNTVVSAPVKYAPKAVTIGNDNQIFFPDPTKTSIEIAPAKTTEAVQKYETALNVTAKNVVSGYIKLEPAGTTFQDHISLEFDVDPFIQPVVYFKSSTDPSPVLIPSSNNSSNGVYYTANTSTGAVTLYTKHFSEAIVTQDQGTINPPVGFVLSKFNTLLAMGVSGELFKESIPAMDVSGIAEYYVKTSDMKKVFVFQTDSRDINNVATEDVKYFVRKNQWPQGLVLNPCHAWVQTSKQIASSDKSGPIPDDKQLVKHDFIRYIAKSMFNTHLGVDLFQNESELKYDLAYKGHNSAWSSIWDSITSISDVSLNTTTYSGKYGTDASYGYYLTNDLSNNSNICRQLLNQVISTAPGRIQDITSYAIDISSGLFSVPLMDGDSISFKLTLQTAPNQHLLLNSATPIQPRSYQIRVNLRDTVTRGTTQQNGTNLIVNDTLPTTYIGSVPTDTLNTSYPANYA